MILSYEKLKSTIEEGLRKIGCELNVAQKTAEALVMAEACGVESHGLRMLSAHAKKIKSREYDIDAKLIVEVETPAFARINCQNQIGMYSASECMEYAIDRAEHCGVFSVFANNCNTFSAAFVYTLLAARRGMLGFVMSNSPAQMAPMGGCSKLLGTNPIAYAIPAVKHNPIVFDMATSVVAKSKINQAKEKGVAIPEGWALDENGLATTDPNEAVKGLVLPMAGAKGYGLAMMIDIFAGLLSKAQFLDGVGRFYGAQGSCMNVGHNFVAINPSIVYGESFCKNVDQYIEKIMSSRAIDGQHIRLPGMKKFECFEKTMQNGFDISDDIMEDFFRIVG